MTRRQALILVHPGSLAAHGGQAALEAAVRELETHPGPCFVIDGFLSDKTSRFDGRIARAITERLEAGSAAARLWGCDAGEQPFPGWPGADLPQLAGTGAIFDSQEEAATALAPFLRGYDLLLSGAWATRDDSSGCVNSVGEALKDAGFAGTVTISDNALFEEDHL